MLIKTTTFLTALILSHCFTANTAYAQKSLADCKMKDQTINERSRCLDGVKVRLDRELQTWVNNHTFNLEEKALINNRYSALKMFKRSQGNFITFRENDCRWQYLLVSQEKDANLAFKKCYIRLTQLRIKELSQIK
ncbi:MAG: lysozyme inhibitor LprI family protein [Colwellia sp.]|jgi:Protein of unknown function (DUF1311).